MPSVTVHCHVPGGLQLQLTEVVTDEFGYQVSRRTGQPVVLSFGENCGVDAEFMRAWNEQYGHTQIAQYVTMAQE